MSCSGGSFAARVGELVSRDPPGRTFAMGGCLYVYISNLAFVMVAEDRLEATLCAPHASLGGDEVEEETERAILQAFREGLGARMMERGWVETGARTTETTLSEPGSSSAVVTELTCTLDVSCPEAAHSEILWLARRSPASLERIKQSQTSARGR